MIAFIEKLNSEVLRSIERIESRDTDVLKKSLEASRVLGEAFDRLKQYIIGYRFQNDDEEIKFFKEIKPRLFCRLIYYRKLYNIDPIRSFRKLIWAKIRQSGGNILSTLRIRKYRSIRLFLRVIRILSGVSLTRDRRYLNRFIRYISISFRISSYSFIYL